MVMTGRAFSAQPAAGQGMEMDAIAAVVIGGTAMEGGKGGFKGTIFGAIFIAAMKNGLQLVGLSNYWQQVLLGVVIIASVAIDCVRKKREAR